MPGSACFGHSHKPLQDLHDGQHDLALDAVIEQIRLPCHMGHNARDPAIRGYRMGWQTCQYAVPEDDLGALGFPVQDVCDERTRAVSKRDQRDASGFEHRFEARSNHAGIPWAPAQRPHKAGRATAGLLRQGHLVEYLVGHRVVALADVAAARRHR